MDESGKDISINTEESSITKEGTIKDPVLEKFQRGELLIHVVDAPGIKKGEEGPEIDFSGWNYKLDLMNSDGGMSETSATLIKEGVPIELYVRPMGFIFDANGADIRDVALRDSGGGANKTEFSSLSELRDYYDNNPSRWHYYNEVVATVKKEDILGLMIRKGVKSESTLAGLEAVIKFIKSKEDLVLPVYEYNEHDGSLRLFKASDRQQLLHGLSDTYKSAYEKIL